MLQHKSDSFQNYMHVHWHEHLELVYIMAGSATMQIDTTFAKVYAGDVIFVNSKQIHSTTNESPDTVIVAIVFNQRLICNGNLDLTEYRYIQPILNQEFRLSNFLDHRHSLNREVVASIERLANEFFLEPLAYELSVKSELFRILSNVVRYSFQDTRSAGFAQRRTYTIHPLDGILQYLQDHLDQKITVPSLANQYNVSASHFCRLFKKLTGNTLVQYVNRIRIQQSERLLRETDMPVADIGEKVGFSNITHFERVFRKIHKTSPSKYRSNLRNRISEHSPSLSF